MRYVNFKEWIKELKEFGVIEITILSGTEFHMQFENWLMSTFTESTKIMDLDEQTDNKKVIHYVGITFNVCAA